MSSAVIQGGAPAGTVAIAYVGGIGGERSSRLGIVDGS